MRIARYRVRPGAPPRIGCWRDGALYELPYGSVLDAAAIAPGRRAAPGSRVADFRLLAPIAQPGKIFGSGINYLSHFEENPAAVRPAFPGFFVKLPTSVIGPGDAIRQPTPATQLDYEVELAVVIGRRGRDLTEANAMEHVFGYTVVNDVSARDIQFGRGQVDLAKGRDTFCPMGPFVVTADEIADPGGLHLRSWVNGELRQQASTAEMLFAIPALLAAASEHITLQLGDVIATGTPAGCGAFQRPPRWLRPGDVVRVEVEGIGSLTNTVQAGW